MSVTTYQSKLMFLPPFVFSLINPQWTWPGHIHTEVTPQTSTDIDQQRFILSSDGQTKWTLIHESSYVVCVQ